MDRNRAKELLPIIEAYANGDVIQFRLPEADWLDDAWTDDDEFLEDDDIDIEYRIKPKPREFFVCSSYDNQENKVAYELDDESLVDHYHEFIRVREVIE